MHVHDWIPKKNSDFYELAGKWAAALGDAGRAAAFGWPAGEVRAVSDAIAACIAAREQYDAADTSRNLLIKKETKTAAVAAMRRFANIAIRYNASMSEEDRMDFGVRGGGGQRSPVPAPQTFPEADIDSSVIRQLSVHFWDSASKRRGKPYGVHGAEIRWAMRETPPASVEELGHADCDTASPCTLAFDESERGRRVYIVLRWESRTNQKGPYGEIYSAIVP